MSRNLVLIDGSNFYHKAKKLSPSTHLTNLDYRKLFSEVTDKKSEELDLVYCVGEVINKRGDAKAGRLFSNQQTLFYNLGEQHIVVKRGFLLCVGEVYHEKGVDVRIALDIQRGAFKNEYDTCFVVSSDTDLLPAVAEARILEKEVVYVGFESFLSSAMVKNCSRTRTITREMLQSCVIYKK